LQLPQKGKYFMMNLSERIGKILLERRWTVCAAESCTGGLLLSSLTDISGSSAYILGGVVTYSNEAKMKFVGVQESTLAAHGAVSEETAREMALGVQKAFGANLAFSVTGIAGPGGGSAEKPVGLVYVGVAVNNELTVQRYLWQGNRVENKAQSVEAALSLALEMLG
jgi:nicotinamide-nucleotide amidase